MPTGILIISSKFVIT